MFLFRILVSMHLYFFLDALMSVVTQTSFYFSMYIQIRTQIKIRGGGGLLYINKDVKSYLT